MIWISNVQDLVNLIVHPCNKVDKLKLQDKYQSLHIYAVYWSFKPIICVYCMKKILRTHTYFIPMCTQIKWASLWDQPAHPVWPAFFLLTYWKLSKTCYMQNFNVLASHSSLAGWIESLLGHKPRNKVFCDEAAQLSPQIIKPRNIEGTTGLKQFTPKLHFAGCLIKFKELQLSWH